MLFLNNDTEVLTPDWLERLLLIERHPEVGAVGGTLFYPDRTIQHAGIFPHHDGRWVHVYRGRPVDCEGLRGELRHVRAVPAVTAACLLMRREQFAALGGFGGLLALVALGAFAAFAAFTAFTAFTVLAVRPVTCLAAAPALARRAPAARGCPAPAPAARPACVPSSSAGSATGNSVGVRAVEWDRASTMREHAHPSAIRRSRPGRRWDCPGCPGGAARAFLS